MGIGETWLDWERDGRDWPHRSASRFVETGGLRWHVQAMGPAHAPALLFLHGTGASSHSWRHVLPQLSTRYRLVAVDLPCHGFTRPRGRADLSLAGMTRSVTDLLAVLSLKPVAIIGHSAGAAIALSVAAPMDRDKAPTVIAINGAFLPIRGDRLFSPMAKLLFANPFSASMFSLLTRTTPLGGNLLTSTGSPIDEAGALLYRRLLTSSGHVRGALGMMAAWDLTRFEALLRSLSASVVLIAAKDDPMVPVRHSEHVARLIKGARLALADRGGHLLHECDAGFVCRIIADAVSIPGQEGADAA
ncbi:alpha/beta fold hydrolase [Rhizobium sp. CG5]|uniref:alpha/beta fold hydrolase BchO n=1 Tax=Rhizobium sp. CG5 TaxID=2726076 RepID=UPI0020349C36|nr:alpha/beta fold hydrolase BchO [Rhizobium sp. CG5]MCM2472498.1 alpha/beta fold hydrolase [Rhizobium sp. CG5]